jgi:peptidyl-prolyl cis-trans isomerase D
VSDDVGTAANGGDLGWMGRGVLPAPLDDTAFSMEIGALAGPVESAFGFHVLKLDNVRLSEQPPFASERERIRSALAEEQAYAAYDAAADELDDAAYNAIDDLAGVAEQLGLELQRIERFSRGNAGEHFVNGDIVAAVVFGDDAVLAGENSELIELAADIVGVVHVAAHHAPEPEPLEAVSDLIRELLTLDAAAELASAAAAEFSDALDPAAVVAETQDPAELAAMYGGSWHEPAWVQRTDVGDVPSAIRSRVLTEIRPTAGAVPKLSIPTGSYDEAVALLLAVEPGVPADIPTDEREQGQQELTSQMALAEFSAYASDTQQRAKVRVPDGVLDPDL